MLNDVPFFDQKYSRKSNIVIKTKNCFLFIYILQIIVTLIYSSHGKGEFLASFNPVLFLILQK